MASQRDGGKDEILAGTEIPLHEQTEKLHTLFLSGSDKYASAGVYYLDAKQEIKIPSKPVEKQKTERTNMKKTLSIIAVCVLALSASAQNTYVNLTIPDTIAGGVTTNVAQVIDVTKQASVAVQATFAFAASSSNGVQTLTFSWSNDRSQWTTQTKAVGLTPNSTTAVSVLTNLPTYGARYMRLDSWANGDGVAVITNIVVNYAVKVGAP